jgi:hypothetical protein
VSPGVWLGNTLAQWDALWRAALGLLGRRILTRDTSLGKLLTNLACGGTSLNTAVNTLNTAVNTALGIPVGPRTSAPEAMPGSMVACTAATAMEGFQSISIPLARWVCGALWLAGWLWRSSWPAVAPTQLQ